MQRATTAGLARIPRLKNNVVVSAHGDSRCIGISKLRYRHFQVLLLIPYSDMPSLSLTKMILHGYSGVVVFERAAYSLSSSAG